MKNYGTVKINPINLPPPPPPPPIDSRTVPPIIPSVSRPKPIAPDNNPSFDVKLHYQDYKLVIRRRQYLQTNLILEYSKNYRRYGNKNILKDIKSFLSGVTSKKQAGNLRKRIIALDKFGKDIEGQEFRFLIDE